MHKLFFNQLKCTAWPSCIFRCKWNVLRIKNQIIELPLSLRIVEIMKPHRFFKVSILKIIITISKLMFSKATKFLSFFWLSGAQAFFNQLKCTAWHCDWLNLLKAERIKGSCLEWCISSELSGDSKFTLQSLTTSKMRKKQSKKLSQFHKAKYLLD